MLARPTSAGRARPFAEVAGEWLALQRTMDLKATTIGQYESHLRNWVIPEHIGWGFRDHLVTSVSGGDIMRLLGEMQSQGRSGSTRKQVFGLIGMICGYALSEGLIATNPHDQVPRSRRPSNKRSRAPQPMTREQTHAIADWVAEQRQELHVDYALIVLLGFYLGMRFSEIATIRRRDLVLPARTLHVANPAKHGDERTIPLLGPTADAVRTYVEELELPPTRCCSRRSAGGPCRRPRSFEPRRCAPLVRSYVRSPRSSTCPWPWRAPIPSRRPLTDRGATRRSTAASTGRTCGTRR